MGNPVSANVSTQQWAARGRAAGVVEEGTKVDGKSAEATRRAQRDSLRTDLRGFVENVVQGQILEIGLAGASRLFGGTAAVLTPLLTAQTLFEGYARGHEEGAALNTAHQRDAVHLAFVLAANEALPADYVDRMRWEMRAVDGEGGGAAKILTRIMSDDQLWKDTQQEAVAHVRVARDFATRAGIASPEALATVLERHPGIAQKYRSDLAFRHGIDSIVFEAEGRRVRGEG